MPSSDRPGRIARVRLLPPVQADLFRDNRERAIAAFVPGTSAERYGRTWLMGQVQVTETLLTGRIGFETEGASTEIWDPERKDFRQYEYPTGTTSPFAVRLDDLQMAFQTRGSVIKVSSFVGAMQALIREATGEEEWRVVTSQERESVRAWQRSVTRVTRARFHLELPNPNWTGRPFVQQIIEGAGAAVGSVTLANPNGIDTDSEIVGQLIDHIERGYGDATLVGHRGPNDEVSTYETRLGGESELQQVPVDDHGDVPPAELGAALGEEPHGGDQDDDSEQAN